MIIRKAAEKDFDGMWSIFQSVVSKGDTYVFSPQATRQDAFEYWFGAGVTSYVADVDGRIEGMYKLIPNQRDLGSHVANASFMVSPDARGNGIERRLVGIAWRGGSASSSKPCSSIRGQHQYGRCRTLEEASFKTLAPCLGRFGT